MPTPTTVTSLLSCSRNLAGCFSRTAAGALTSFPADTLRITNNGLLVEGARTNTVYHSLQVGKIGVTSPWTLTNVTVDVNNATAPDGTLRASRITDTAANVTHNLTVPGSSATWLGYAPGTVSVYAKAGTISNIFIQVTDNAAFGVAIFDLAAGKVGAWWNLGAVHIARTTIDPHANGWFRCSVMLDNLKNFVKIGMVPWNAFPMSTAVSQINCSYLGAGTGTVYLWGPQIESGPYCSSYIETTTNATVTRPADVITLIGSADAITNVGSTTATSIVAEVKSMADVPDDDHPIICGTAGAPAFLHKTDCRRVGMTISTELESGQSPVHGNFTTGIKIGCTWDSSGRSVCAHAGTVTTGAIETFAAGDRFIGDGTFFGYVKNIRLWSSRISDGILQYYTRVTAPTVGAGGSTAANYFSVVGDHVTLVAPTYNLYTPTGSASAYWADGQYYNPPTWTAQFNTAAHYVSDFVIGKGRHWHVVNVGGDTVSLGATAVAPDGTLTARKIVDAALDHYHFLTSGLTHNALTGSFDTPMNYRASVFAKAAERTRIMIAVQDFEDQSSGTSTGGWTGLRAVFDLAGGQVAVQPHVVGNSTTLWTDVSASITAWGTDGWYKCEVFWTTVTVGSGYDGPLKVIFALDAGYGTNPEYASYPGDGISGVYAWRANVMFVEADTEITTQLFHDHFDDVSKFDMNDTRLPGYNWYLHSTWPNLTFSPWDVPVDPDLTVVQDSWYRPQMYSSVWDARWINSCAWIGNVTLANAKETVGLHDPVYPFELTTPWETMRSFFVGTVYTPPIFTETRMKYDPTRPIGGPPPAWWCRSAEAYLTPRWTGGADMSGTIVGVFPSPLYNIEADFQEDLNNGNQATYHVLGLLGDYSTRDDSAQINLMWRGGEAGTDETLPHVYSTLWLTPTATSQRMWIQFYDGVYVSIGLIDGAPWDIGDTQHYLMWVGGLTSEYDYVTIYGQPGGAIQGTATGPA